MLEILYQDEYIVAINKPAGLLVHRSKIDLHETRFAVQMLRDQIGQRVYPVHRLDKPTAGVLVFALDPESAKNMALVFQNNKIEKYYLAVVRGYAAEADIINYPLKEQLDKMTDYNVDPDKPAQEAITEYQCLAKVELPYAVGRYQSSRYSLLSLSPKTGRKHQLRRHMKHIFHPIVGDTSHGDGKHNVFFREQFDCHRLLLSSVMLKFNHPVKQNKIHISASLDQDFKRILERLGWASNVENLSS